MSGSGPLAITLLIALVLALVAAAHDSARRKLAPETLPYVWGYFIGYSSIAVGLLITLAGTVGMVNRPAQSTEEAQGATLVLLWGAALTTSGVGIISRCGWAWILRICIWPNLITLIINIFYYRRRRAELDGVSQAVAATSTPPPVASGNASGRLGLIALLVAGAGGVATLVMTVVSAYMLSADPAALDQDKPEAVLLGLLVVLAGGAVVGGSALGIASLWRKESKRWPAIVALGTSCSVVLLYGIGTLLGETPMEQPRSEMTTGTGFFVTSNGYLVTCRHVIENEGKVTVLTARGSAPAEVIAVHQLLDLALLKVDADVTCLPIGKSSELPLGAAVSTLGFPNVEVQGFEPKLTKGHVAALSGPQDDPAYVQLGMPIAPGYSGAAVLDEAGNAIGVATMILDEKLAANVSYATKGELVFLFLLDAARKMKLPDLTPPRPLDPGNVVDIDRVRDSTVLVISDADA